MSIMSGAALVLALVGCQAEPTLPELPIAPSSPAVHASAMADPRATFEVPTFDDSTTIAWVVHTTAGEQLSDGAASHTLSSFSVDSACVSTFDVESSMTWRLYLGDSVSIAASGSHVCTGDLVSDTLAQPVPKGTLVRLAIDTDGPVGRAWVAIPTSE